MPPRYPRLSPKKRLSEIREEWDRAAEKRAALIDNLTDISFHRLLLPSIDRLSTNWDWTDVLDAGCGTGFLSERLAKRARHVVAVDVSKKSIAIAKTAHSAPNLRYQATSIEQLARRSPGSQFTLAVANMTLMTVPNLTSFLAGIARLLRPEGAFVFTSTHPWFWPLYWNYANCDWFDYGREIPIEAPLRISLDERGPVTTHYHRPLSMYIAELSRANLLLDVLEEPLPDPEDAALYPEPWEYPRFLSGRCVLHGRAA
jgi:2-polyprenyl-3-methyl-5-hydroxy-6-metoxy-1,4-benzoquinol methylase